MRLVLYLLCLIVCWLKCAESAKILGVFPIASHSHYTVGARLMKELAAKGHDVTMLSPYDEKVPIPNYKTVMLTGFVESMNKLKKEMNMFDISGRSKWIGIYFINAMGYKLTESTLEHPNTKKLMEFNEKYDVIIIEQFVNEALRGLCYHFNAPCITLSAVGSNYWNNLLVANPTNPSYIPEMALEHAGPMNFWQRLENTALAVYTQTLYHLVILPSQNKLMHKHFPNAPALIDLMHNTPLVLLNSHVSTTDPVPHVPNMIEIGGYHVSPPKKLSDDLKKYLDSAKEGVIFFSMGSNLRSQDFPIEKRKSILNAFAKLKMKVLWKFEEDLPEKSDNVKISKWLPQQDILAHPNIKLFISHGGLLSTIEAIYHGVPVIGIPIFGDQMSNMIQAANAGFAVVLPYSNITEESVTTAINEVSNNLRYTKDAKLRSQIMHDQPMKPIDKAVYWVEYVIKYKGAPQLRSAAMDLTWYQYLLLDVILFMTAAMAVVFFIFYLIFKWILGKKKPKPNNDKNKNKKYN